MKKNNKNRAFTLIEILLVIAIGSILLLYISHTFIFNFISAGSRNSKDYDLQTGVKVSIDEIASTLKNSIQVHLVGETVYNKTAETNKLDKSYNYIALRTIKNEDGSERDILANLVYNSSKDDFDVLPIVALDKDDILKKNNIEYGISFYENDKENDEYQKKLEKKILNITVKGIAKDAEVDSKGSKYPMEYELTKDIHLANVNQISISQFLKGSHGGIDNITAIAYDNGHIEFTEGGKEKVAIVFVVDTSNSMYETVGNVKVKNIDPRKVKNYFIATYQKVGTNKFNFGYYLFNNGYSFVTDDKVKWKDRDFIKNLPNNIKDLTKDEKNSPDNYAIRMVSAEKAIIDPNKGFLYNLKGKAKEKNIDMLTYIYNYDTYVKHRDPYNSIKKDSAYIWELKDLEEKGYGPYNLYYSSKDDENNKEKVKGLDEAVDWVKNDCEIGFNDDHYTSKHFSRANRGSTNTGEALLQAFEILKQLREKGIKKRFLVLMTDGEPTVSSKIVSYDRNNYYFTYDYLSSRATYDNIVEYYPNNTTFDLYLNPKDNNPDYGMDYVKRVAKENNEVGLYEKAFIIGFSGIEEEVKKIGYDKDEDGRDMAVPDNSIRKYLENTGSEVGSYRAKDSDALNDAFEDIGGQIAAAIGVFDGPKEME